MSASVKQSVMRRIVPRLLAAACLLALGGLGTYNGINELRDVSDKTALQQSVSMGRVVYGIFGLAAGVGVLLGRRWGYLVSLVWSIAITYTGGMAAYAYGGTAALGTAIAFLITAVIAGIVVWLAKIGIRGLDEAANHD